MPTSLPNPAVSIISGPIVAAISGGTRRKIGVSQVRSDRPITLAVRDDLRTMFGVQDHLSHNRSISPLVY